MRKERFLTNYKRTLKRRSLNEKVDQYTSSKTGKYYLAMSMYDYNNYIIHDNLEKAEECINWDIERGFDNDTEILEFNSLQELSRYLYKNDILNLKLYYEAFNINPGEYYDEEKLKLVHRYYLMFGGYNSTYYIETRDGLEHNFEYNCGEFLAGIIPIASSNNLDEIIAEY